MLERAPGLSGYRRCLLISRVPTRFCIRGLNPCPQIFSLCDRGLVYDTISSYCLTLPSHHLLYRPKSTSQPFPIFGSTLLSMDKIREIFMPLIWARLPTSNYKSIFSITSSPSSPLTPNLLHWLLSTIVPGLVIIGAATLPTVWIVREFPIDF